MPNSNLGEACLAVLSPCTANIISVREGSENSATKLVESISALTRLLGHQNKAKDSNADLNEKSIDTIESKLVCSMDETSLLRGLLNNILKDVEDFTVRLQDMHAKLYPILIELDRPEALQMAGDIFSVYIDLRQSVVAGTKLVDSAISETCNINQQKKDNVDLTLSEKVEHRSANRNQNHSEIQKILYDMMIELQYHDRSSQILEAVQATLTKFILDLTQIMEEDPSCSTINLNIEKLLAFMRSRYVTNEQYQNDTNHRPGSESGAESGEIIFF